MFKSKLSYYLFPVIFMSFNDFAFVQAVVSNGTFTFISTQVPLAL